ncbi:E3 ubiquitin protein ligase UPL3-like protein isoform X1 [Tanacetum coccineum]
MLVIKRYIERKKVFRERKLSKKIRAKRAAFNKQAIWNKWLCNNVDLIVALTFFVISQRVALSTVAIMCKKLPSDEADFVIESIPLLKNLLQYHDERALEHASVCLNQIPKASALSSNQLDELCVRGFVKKVITLILTTSSRGGKASLNSSTYTMAKEQIYISIFVAGHVDSGKSTTTGLLSENQMVDALT